MGHFCSEWLVVQNGRVVAEVTDSGVRWMKGDGSLEEELLPKLNRDGARLPAQDRFILKTDARKRHRERRRCAKLGIAVPEWAAPRRGSSGFAEQDASFMRGRRYKTKRMVSEEAEA